MTAPPAPSSAPLSGMLVADLSRVLAGPYATMLLADLGADVVKVEHPERGDDTRAWGPPWAGDQSAYYLALNRGKRSLAVDLKDPDGLAAVRTLCARADVVVQNFRPGTAERLGLGYADVAADNPGVVYCSISGFGPGHLRPDRPGFDVVIQGESGLMSTTGTPEGGPTKIGIPLADVLTGLNATTAVCAALVRRATTGRGEHIHVSLLNSALSALVQVGQSALVTGAEPERVGHAHPSIVPYQTFPTADGDIIIAAGNDALYRALCTVVERPDLAEDPRFRRNADRVAHRDILVAELTAALAKRSAEEWTALLSDAGVPVGKVRGVAEALRTADASGDEATMTVDHPVLGAVELIRPGFRFTGAAPQHGPAVLPPPLLGQHSVEVLRELGLSEERITALVERGTVVQHPVH
ncbi:CoA transferase [Thermobifida fusca]|uniref:CaiB/BaiF family protein n=2 Tax=Thermobifida fusca TaxID=2021 RepID=A0A9P2TAS8_THEFU|nr:MULTISPECIES: CaiB/BaiF CoA-transferase family protein [Thermobifida]AAZ55107.1 CaiB/BaiF family protein [Thermobifida fusca YX]EOR71799.1 CaiB/BaiF family protein [Thermobifida fusca TM51]MBO2528819.1 CoA transferase [Thermobifida sp.]MDD6792523.1 CaiB/BaiF CoA-transferase family protein [Thermobifida fusca]PPS96064.1 formyl-CoA transferase [Thermobifida fusca]